MRVLISVCIAIALGGCAEAYVVRPTAEKAMVRFMTDTTDSSTLNFVDIETCPAPNLTRIAIVSVYQPTKPSLNMLGAGGLNEKLIAESEIEAGRLLHFMAQSSVVATAAYTSGYTCKVGFTFSPRQGRQYEISYSYDRLRARCGIRVSELTRDATGDIKRVPETTRSFPADLEQYCKR